MLRRSRHHGNGLSGSANDVVLVHHGALQFGSNARVPHPHSPQAVHRIDASGAKARADLLDAAIAEVGAL